jgi:polysaccharide biosynthesis transport protein
MDNESAELELRDYLTVLRRRKLVVATTTVAVVTLALTASFLQTKTYKAGAELLLQPRASERIFAPEQDPTQRTDRQAQVDTEIQVMKSRSVKSAVADQLHMSASVSIAPKGATDVVTISATSSDPAQAARIANVYADVYIKTRRQQAIDDLLAAATQVQSKLADIDQQLSDLDAKPAQDPAIAAQKQALFSQRGTYSQQLSQLQLAGSLTESGGAQLVSKAETPSSPIRPTPLRNAVLAAILGLILGAGLAFLVDHLDDSLRTRDQLEIATRLTLLGSIPTMGTWKKGTNPRIVTLADPSSAAAEAYRGLRTSLQFLRLDAPIRTIQFTSATASEGKTTTVANLAVALASAGQRVLVVCCDLRRPRIHQFFGVKNDVGLTSVLLGDASLAQATQSTDVDGVEILASGPLPPGPSELLASERTQDLIAALATMWDAVLIDSAPILPVSDSLVLAGHVDSTLLVAASGRATQREVTRAVDALRLVDAPLLGAVFNGAPAGDDGYGYAYTYTSSPDRSKPSHRASRNSKRRRESAYQHQSSPS